MQIMKTSIALMGILYAAGLFAYTPPAPKSSRASAALVLLENEYDHNNATIRTHGDMLYASYKTPVSPRLSLGGGFGLLVDGRIDEFDGAKNNLSFRLDGDGDFMLAQFNKDKLLATFGLGIDRFSYHGNNTTIDLNTVELALGGLYTHHIQKVGLYGGLELFLVANDSMTVKVGNLSTSTDLDRSSKIDLRLGVTFDISQATDLRVDLYLIGEQTILLGFDMAT